MAKQLTDTFLLRKDFFPQIRLLTREQRGDLLTAIFAYASDEALPEMDDVTRMCFGFIRTSLDANSARYRARCERNRLNGLQGGRPKTGGSDEGADAVGEAFAEPGADQWDLAGPCTEISASRRIGPAAGSRPGRAATAGCDRTGDDSAARSLRQADIPADAGNNCMDDASATGSHRLESIAAEEGNERPDDAAEAGSRLRAGSVAAAGNAHTGNPETERFAEEPAACGGVARKANGSEKNRTVCETTDGFCEKPKETDGFYEEPKETDGFFENPVDLDYDLDLDRSSSSPSPACARESDGEVPDIPPDAMTAKIPEKGCAEKAPAPYAVLSDYVPVREVAGYLRGNTVWFEAFCMNNRLDPEFVKRKIDEFARDLEDGGETEKERRDCTRHFKNWMRKNREKHEQRPTDALRVGTASGDGSLEREHKLRERVAARLARAEARKMGV